MISGKRTKKWEPQKRTFDLLIKLKPQPIVQLARHDVPGEETEVVKEGTGAPLRGGGGTRGQKAERNPSEKFHRAVCSFLARETRATFTRARVCVGT